MKVSLVSLPPTPFTFTRLASLSRDYMCFLQITYIIFIRFFKVPLDIIFRALLGSDQRKKNDCVRLVKGESTIAEDTAHEDCHDLSIIIHRGRFTVDDNRGQRELLTDRSFNSRGGG
jgi:hypothetical protein